MQEKSFRWFKFQILYRPTVTNLYIFVARSSNARFRKVETVNAVLSKESEIVLRTLTLSRYRIRGGRYMYVYNTDCWQIIATLWFMAIKRISIIRFACRKPVIQGVQPSIFEFHETQTIVRHYQLAQHILLLNASKSVATWLVPT